MPQGQVSKWVAGADEGRILGDDGQEVELHPRDLADPSTEGNLAVGQRVDYEVKDSGSGLTGWNVRLL
jgi:hypothetical protein